VTRHASRSDHEGAARCTRSRRYAFVGALNGVGAGACRFTIIETPHPQQEDARAKEAGASAATPRVGAAEGLTLGFRKQSS
jgi:hypothetical protein